MYLLKLLYYLHKVSLYNYEIQALNPEESHLPLLNCSHPKIQVFSFNFSSQQGTKISQYQHLKLHISIRIHKGLNDALTA